MSDGPGDRESRDGGMGDRSGGPDFAAPPPLPEPSAPRPSTPPPTAPLRPAAPSASRPHADPPRPRGRALPVVLGAVVIAVVAAVAIGATVVASRPETGASPTPGLSGRPSAGPSASPSPTPGAGAANTAEFSTPLGDGRVTVLSHRWSTTGRDTGSPDPTHTYLDVQVEVACTAGQVDIEPASFQVFDREGDTYLIAEDRVVSPGLESDVAFDGDTKRGWVSFDAPRGDVTLIFGLGNGPAAAIRVPA